ncbi:MAG: hypothetical protein ABIL05_01430 [candidate division WOR-3 bacterium]
MEEVKQGYAIFDRVNPGLRSLFSAGLILLAFLFQLNTRSFWTGLPLLIICIAINWMKNISTRALTADKREWVEVTPEKILLVYEQARRIKKFRSGNFGIGCLIAIIFLSIFFLPAFAQSITLSPFIVYVIIDALILFAGLTISGRRSAWMAPGLDLKAEIINRLLNAPIIKDDPGLKAIPLLEIGKSTKGDFPIDVRLKLKFIDAPEDFLGIQGQISINSVKSTDYPYFYSVVIAKKSFNLLAKIGKQEIERLVIETQTPADVDVVVLRQKTTRTSGYYTDKNQQDYILFNAIKLTKEILKK